MLTRRYTVWIALFLIAAFVVPKALQMQHVIFVRHHRNGSYNVDYSQLHKSNERCLMHEYVFALLHKIEPILHTEYFVKFIGILSVLKESDKKILTVFFYNLRAPPKRLIFDKF